MKVNAITYEIIGAAYDVHKALGPGLLESTYEICLIHKLMQKGLSVESLIIIEIKAVELLAPVHYAQLLTYLKLSGCKVGLLINLNVPDLKEGIKRLIN